MRQITIPSVSLVAEWLGNGVTPDIIINLAVAEERIRTAKGRVADRSFAVVGKVGSEVTEVIAEVRSLLEQALESLTRVAVSCTAYYENVDAETLELQQHSGVGLDVPET